MNPLIFLIAWTSVSLSGQTEFDQRRQILADTIVPPQDDFSREQVWAGDCLIRLDDRRYAAAFFVYREPEGTIFFDVGYSHTRPTDYYVNGSNADMMEVHESNRPIIHSNKITPAVFRNSEETRDIYWGHFQPSLAQSSTGAYNFLTSGINERDELFYFVESRCPFRPACDFKGQPSAVPFNEPMSLCVFSVRKK